MANLHTNSKAHWMNVCGSLESMNKNLELAEHKGQLLNFINYNRKRMLTFPVLKTCY